MKVATAVALGWAACWRADAAPEADRVASLPGKASSFPLTQWFSGYLSFGKKHLHYVFVESESKDPEAPVVLWMNGGPGCSSMDGLFYEHGPALVDTSGKLHPNPHSWNKLAHMLYLEAPVGVGYSYSDDTDDYQHLDDNVTASDNLQALKVFFSKFPEHKPRPFYVTGESYGGVYVPTLSLKIFEDSTVDWNMKGFAVGNGVFDWGLMQKSGVEFLYGHGGISSRDKAAVDAACKADYSSQACQQELGKVESKTTGLNMYDFYRECFHHGAGMLTGAQIAKQPELLREVIMSPRPPHPSVGEDVPCIDSTGGTAYLAMKEVRSALHIEPSLDDWTICSAKINYKRDMSYSAPKLYTKMKDHYKILVYNGDTDMACDFVADSWAVDSINVSISSEMDWVPWKIPDQSRNDQQTQIAGYVTKYETKPGMFFLTVKGAGHMVPQWKPEAALEMMRRFLDGSHPVDGTVPNAFPELVV